MITFRPNAENIFLIYKTQIEALDDTCTLKIQNILSDQNKVLDFEVSESLRAFTVTIPETDLSPYIGQNRLTIETNSAIIYNDEVRVIVNDLQ